MATSNKKTKAQAKQQKANGNKKPTVKTSEATTPAQAASDLKADAAANYAKLNTAFLAKYNKRPIFGEKRPTAIDLAKHNPTSATERDNAFIHAIRTVYGQKPFTANDVRCDTGNIARAIKLGMLQSLGTIDGAETFKLSPSMTASPATAKA